VYDDTPLPCQLLLIERCHKMRRPEAIVKRGELTDEAWARIAPLLPENLRRGGRWRGHRQVVNGILWTLRTGAPWRNLPERYGLWQTCY
jgi:transposase